MRIGLRYFGRPLAMYDLSRDEQVELLALDEVEQEDR